MNDLLADLAATLDDLRAQTLYRTLTLPSGLDFSSNDYLGLSGDGSFRRVTEILDRRSPLTTPASRLLRGHSAHHQSLETRLARFKGTEAALLFATGYQANLGLLTTLVRPRDRVLSDALNHASLIDGCRLARPTIRIFPHRDVDALRRLVASPHASGRTFILTESLFSMDGDIAPLDRYAELAERHGASLVVDDAHATGVFGSQRGSGLVEDFGVGSQVVAVVSTFGKAFGICGAFVAAPRVVIEYLVNRCRPFVFSTAPPPLLLAAIEVALDAIETQPNRRHTVLARAEQLRRMLREAGLRGLGERGPIVPVVLGKPGRPLAAAAGLRARGFDVRAIRPPSVPPGTSRLRVSVHADHSASTIDALARAIVDVVQPATASLPSRP